MAEQTSRLLKLSHDFHVVQAICEQSFYRIVVFEMPDGIVVYRNQAAAAYLNHLCAPLPSEHRDGPMQLAHALPKAVWHAWLADARKVLDTNEPLHSFDLVELVHAHTMPVYSQVVARCMLAIDDLLVGGRSGKIAELISRNLGCSHDMQRNC